MRKLTQDERFFYDNAGFAYDPAKETRAQGRRNCAIALAKAERLAKDAGAAFEWEDDQDGAPEVYRDGAYWHDPGDGDLMRVEQSEACIMRLDGRVLASLCGIWDADANYRRVVQAELAIEAEDELRAAVALESAAADHV